MIVTMNMWSMHKNAALLLELGHLYERLNHHLEKKRLSISVTEVQLNYFKRR